MSRQTEALSFAIEFLNLLPSIVQMTEELAALVQNTSVALKAMQAEHRDPTPEEWAALDAQVQALRDQLHA